MSLIINYGYSDIYSQFSDNAKYIVIRQQATEENSLCYSDVEKLLSYTKTKGTVLLDMGGGTIGYVLFLFNGSGEKPYSGVFADIDTGSDTPQMIIKPQFMPYSMLVDNVPVISFMGNDAEITGYNIYSGLSGADYICNIAVLKNSGVKFQGLTLIMDGAAEEISGFLNDIKSQNSSVRYTEKSLSEVAEQEHGFFDNAIEITVILLVGLLMTVNSGVFISSWLRAKRQEIAARRICGASPSDIKRLVFINTVTVCFTGTAAGFLLTYIATKFTGLSFYLGNMEPMAGFISTAFFTMVGVITAYIQSVKYSGEQIVMIRRE